VVALAEVELVVVASVVAARSNATRSLLRQLIVNFEQNRNS